MSKDPILSRRLDDLEHRLERYHADLTDVIDQRDRLALDASSGLSAAMLSLINKATAAAIAAATFLAVRFLVSLDWVAFAAALVVFVTYDVFAERRSYIQNEKARRADRAALDPLPAWRNKAEDKW